HWGLASVDPACLTVISYLQLLGYDEWGVIECNNPNVSPTGELPVLKDGLEWVAGVYNIIRYLKKKGKKLIVWRKHWVSLLRENIYDSLVSTALMSTGTFPSRLLIMNFINQPDPVVHVVRQFQELHRNNSPALRKITPLSNPIYRTDATARCCKSQIGESKRLRQLNPSFTSRACKINHDLVFWGGSQMHKVIQESYNVLLKKIGDKEYFFDRSSTIDAVAYGHLALHLYADLPIPDLPEILNNEYPRLVQFCHRMKSRLSSRPINHLPATDLPSVFSGLIGSPRTWFTRTSKTERAEAQIKFERKRNLSILGAITFVIIYVVWNGIITVEWDGVANDDDNENHESLSGQK
ncbi:14959_t:CDS:2, partial [Acaulospora colombiana]